MIATSVIVIITTGLVAWALWAQRRSTRELGDDIVSLSCRAYNAGFIWGVEVALREHRDTPDHEIDQLIAALKDGSLIPALGEAEDL